MIGIYQTDPSVGPMLKMFDIPSWWVNRLRGTFDVGSSRGTRRCLSEICPAQAVPPS